MNLGRIKHLLTGEEYHDRILDSFELGKYIIIYGSILLLTILGIIVWIFGAINIVFLVWQSIMKWGFSHEATTAALQQLETSAILLLDIFLLSVVLFIVAIGLYGIFINKREEEEEEEGEVEEGIKLPVDIREISELERYLFGTIVAILLVAALNTILNPEESTTPIENAITIGMICAVVLVISIYLAAQRSRNPPRDEKDDTLNKE